MKQEFILIFVAGLFILAYVLDAVSNPLGIRLATPYQFFNPQTLSLYPFTTTSIVIKAVALFIIPLWLLPHIISNRLIQGATVLVLSGLMQLYALQDVATGSKLLPLEWSLSITLAGVVLLAPAVFFLLAGLIKQALGNSDSNFESDIDVDEEGNFWDGKDKDKE